MWTSSPIVVTTISRQAVRASTKKPVDTLNWPAGIHSQNVIPWPCSPNGAAPPSAPAATIIAATQAIPTIAIGTALAAAAGPLRQGRRECRADGDGRDRLGRGDDRGGLAV